MSKIKFVAEFEINASPKMIYPFLSTAVGLKEWFAEDVNMNEDRSFGFMWDGVQNKAMKTAQKSNQMIKFEFVPTDKEEKKNVSYLDLKLEENELTQTSFLKVTDYSEAQDMKELQELWDNLIDNLRGALGSK